MKSNVNPDFHSTVKAIALRLTVPRQSELNSSFLSIKPAAIRLEGSVGLQLGDLERRFSSGKEQADGLIASC